MSEIENISSLIREALKSDKKKALNLWEEEARKSFFCETFSCHDLGEVFFKAFTHPSFDHEQKKVSKNYERLEFLGDSLLQTWCSLRLFEAEQGDEGKLSIQRSAIVNQKSLAEFSRVLEFPRIILVGKGEEKQRGYQRDSILSDVFESFLGACYQKTRDIFRIFEVLDKLAQVYEERGRPLFSKKNLEGFDDKTKFQNLVMKNSGKIPRYQWEKIGNSYEVSLYIGEKKCLSLKSNHIKNAERELAKKALKKKLYERPSCL